MRCVFNSVTLHNFLSFGDATIDLRNKGYCLVKGKNTNPSDRALSNGAGKSTIVSSICWTLTGKTIQGVTSNIENLYTTGGCFVSLDFNVDGDNYVVTRYKNHEVYKTDLKIMLNGKDVSGASFRKSEEELAKYLPDITFDLLSSVIFLGQGLPNSFTKDTPSKRKEKLEQLTKSDFMIQDIKNRLASRQEVLTGKIKKVEDSNIQVNTSLTYTQKRLQQVKEEVEKLTYSNYEDDLSKANSELLNLQTQLDAVNTQFEIIGNTRKALDEEITEKDNAFNEEYKKTGTEGYDNIKKVEIEIALIRSNISNLENEIRKLDNIKDVCPTCGQKLPNVHKVDTTEQKKELENLKETLNQSLNLKSSEEKRYKALLDDMKSLYDSQMYSKRVQLGEVVNSLSMLQTQQTGLNNQIIQCQAKIDTCKQLIEVYNTQKTKLEQEEQDLNSNIIQLNNDLLYNNKELDELNSHLDVITKMGTLVKRDFRGFLLQNILAYIEAKAQEYCKYTFGTSNLEIKQDRNEIAVTFCGKEYEALSGGEKQKVDLIIQFALRDMMSKYLNFNSNIIFLDEITDNLDSVGCSGLMSLISYAFGDIESVFIISHHTDELSIPVDNEIVILKDETCISRIVN